MSTPDIFVLISGDFRKLVCQMGSGAAFSAGGSVENMTTTDIKTEVDTVSPLPSIKEK